MSLDSFLKKRNIIIYFFMIGCPYCEKTTPLWNELKDKHKEIEFVEVESQDITPEKKEELEIEGYPQFLKINKDGKKKKVRGSKDTLQQLEKELELGKFFGGRRRRSRRFRNRIRKTRRFRRT
jgi:thiol-disulfide isomerase/thioredoxin